MNLYRSGWLITLVCLVMCRCANIGRPEGGPRDEDPPVMDSSASTKTFQTNFHPDQTQIAIELVFNEWVKLESPQKQVVISPPLQYTPKIELRGRAVQVKLDPREKLLDNTTYTINFGTSVQDLNEGNKAENLRFVFSTGPVIDSGEVNGKVYEALTGETKEDLFILLYYSSADSVVYRNRPIYFGRTNKSGVFSIQNIKDTTYKIFVLEDANSNYLYDQDKENIGFLDRRIKTGEDSSTLLIPYFKSFVRPRLLSYSTERTGVIKIQSNVPLEELVTTSLDPSITLHRMIDKDTVLVFYSPEKSRDWALKVMYKDTTLDTLFVNRIRINNPDSLRYRVDFPTLKTLAAGEHVSLSFNQPIDKIDSLHILFKDDTLNKLLPINIYKTNQPNILAITCPCEEKHGYSLILLPGAITNQWGATFGDSIKIKIQSLAADQSGTMVLTIEGLDSSKQYLVHLIANDQVVLKNSHLGASTYTITYKNLLPSTYTIEIIEDENNNLKWDTGNYRLKRQPEKIKIQKNYNVRSNWELRETIIWKP